MIHKMMQPHISKNAQNILLFHFNDKESILSVEILDHDGYDKYGPESNLWTFYIITKENNQYILYRYYFEDWYLGYKPNEDTDSMYNIETKCNIEDIEYYDLHKLEKYIETITDTDLKIFLNSRFSKIK